jgi:acetyl-CoA C-acetyltransferase
MGKPAENIAAKYGISRQEQDEFAYNSQLKTQNAIAGGLFKDEIIPVPIKSKKQTIFFDTDEHPRLSALEDMAKLKPAFKPDGSVTAGNSSGRNDGAALLLVAEEEKAKELGLKPMARIIGQAAAGVSPAYMGMGPVPATRLALQRAGLELADIGLIELNEAFAAQSLGVIRELGIN